MITAEPKRQYDCRPPTDFGCPLDKTCSECLHALGEESRFTRRLDIMGKPREYGYGSVTANSLGVFVLGTRADLHSDEYKRTEPQCISKWYSCYSVPADSPIAQALDIVGEHPDPALVQYEVFPGGWRTGEEMGMRTAEGRAKQRSRYYSDHEACVPFQLFEKEIPFESNSLTVLNAFGTQEFMVGPWKAKEDPIPLCLRTSGPACPAPHSLRYKPGCGRAILEGDPSRMYIIECGEGEVLDLAPECRFPPPRKLTANTPVYIQDVRAVLHLTPAFKGWLAAIAPIGTACTALGPPKGDWLELQCGKAKGFVLAWQVSTEPPSAEAFRKKAADTRLPAAQQLNYALRALALSPDDGAAQTAFVDSYYAIRFREYAKVHDDEDERSFDCASLPRAPDAPPPDSAQACLKAAFRTAPFEWDTYRFSGQRFIRTVRRERWLEEDSGTFTGDATTMKVMVSSRKWFGLPGVLDTVLAPRAERAAPGHPFDTSKPLLTPDSFARLIKLPRHWMTMEDGDTMRVRDSMCEYYQHNLSWTLNGAASMSYASGQDRQDFTILSYGMDDMMEVCQGNCERREKHAFEPPNASTDGVGRNKTARVQDFFTGEYVTLGPADWALQFPRVNEAHCEGTRYVDDMGSER